MKPNYLGNLGEDLAEQILLSEGYAIIARNYRCRAGEIDLIAREGCFVAFIEVKTRKRIDDALLAVNRRKMLHLRRAAAWFLVESGLSNCPCRFDVIAIERNGDSYRYEIIRDAF